MRLFMLGAAALALTACQTRPMIEQSTGDTFEVKYDPALSSASNADDEAAAFCGERAEFLSQRARWDSMVFRRYRCPE